MRGKNIITAEIVRLISPLIASTSQGNIITSDWKRSEVFCFSSGSNIIPDAGIENERANKMKGEVI
jgi:hypothetical protein